MDRYPVHFRNVHYRVTEKYCLTHNNNTSKNSTSLTPYPPIMKSTLIIPRFGPKFGQPNLDV